jgi:hypothetical protein
MKFRPLYLIILFVFLFLYLVAREANAEVQVEAGPTNLSYDWAHGYTFLISEQFGKYNLGLGFISDQRAVVTCGPHLPRSSRCIFQIRNNIFVQAERIVRYKECELGLGPAYFNNTSRITASHFNIGLMVGCNLSERVFVRLRHWSNAGAASPNLGQDVITIGWRF